LDSSHEELYAPLTFLAAAADDDDNDDDVDNDDDDDQLLNQLFNANIRPHGVQTIR